MRLQRLTALRWVAASLVFLTHINLEVLHVDKLGRLTTQGSSGVDFFFILSGFVLAWSHRPGDTPAAFYRRRVARIVPLYIVAWVGGLAVSTGLYGAGVLEQLPSLLLVQAWVPHFQIVFAGAVVLWSLSCEAFFYAIFPLLIGPLSRARDATLSKVVVAMVVLAVAIPVALHPSITDEGWRFLLSYSFPPTRLCEFVLGAAAAVLVSRGALPRVPLPAALTLAAIVYVAAGWAPTYLLPVALTVVPFGLVIVAAAQCDIAGAGPIPRWQVRLGEWSYAFFLVQILIMRVTVQATIHLVGAPTLPARVVLAVLVFAVSLAVAAVLCEFVEKPLERRLRGDGSLPMSLTAADPPVGTVDTSDTRRVT